MKLRSEVSEQKLRGGYYTPAELVRFCWSRVAELLDGDSLRVLEPSAGDGQFFKHAPAALQSRISSVVAVEIDPAEARKCGVALGATRTSHLVVAASFLQWALDDESRFDVAIGNPPFVRFQFVSAADSNASTVIGDKLGTPIRGVSNLWMPILLAALAKLTEGGAAAFVVPGELFTGGAAATVRRWILTNMSDVRIDVFPPAQFRGVLQEVVVLSGRRTPRAPGGAFKVTDHASGRTWMVAPQADEQSWMRAFLSPDQLAAFEFAKGLAAVRPLRGLARMQVSIVTGANDYFCMSDDALKAYQLERWAIPLLPRARNARGLVWTARDQMDIGTASKSWLIHFDADGLAPQEHEGARRFLMEGVRQEIPSRYKCRTRSPWYRVPDVWAGSLLLSKRCHRYPRLLLNEASSYTTDTIYRGRILPGAPISEQDLVAVFHNSLTLLSAELEGRSFGGGVHELVPSEIARLLVPAVGGFGKHLDELDALARTAPTPSGEILVQRTDQLLVLSDIGLDAAVLELLAEGRLALLDKRLARASSEMEPVEEALAV